MANDEITSAHAWSVPQRRRLQALLDTILPASEDGTMPSAAELDFIGYLNEQAKDKIPALARIVESFGDEFSDRPLSARVALVETYAKDDPGTFDDLLFRVYDCYYQDARVCKLIGTQSGPPFPRGNTIVPGDLSGLAAVVKRGRAYRR